MRIQSLIVAFVSIPCLICSADTSEDSFVGDYLAGIGDSIFPAEMSLSCTKISKKRNGLLTSELRYCQSGDKRLVEEIYSGSEGRAVRDEDTLYSSLLIDADSRCVFLTHVLNAAGTYFVDTVLHDQEEISRVFSDVLPLSAPYCIRNKTLSELFAEETFRILRMEDIDESTCAIDWRMEVQDRDKSIELSGDIEIDKSNGWVVRKATETVGIVGKPPLYTHFIDIEYGNISGRSLPSRVVVRKVSGSDDTSELSSIEFADIEYDFSPVDSRLFELSHYGVGLPEKEIGIVYYCLIASILIAMALVIVRKQLAMRSVG